MQEKGQQVKQKLDKGDTQLVQEFLAEVSDSLYDFCRHILGYDLLEREVHQPVCDFVQGRRLENENVVRNRKLVLMPRDSFKSTIITVGYTIMRLVLDPNLRILIASENFANSKRYLKQIREQFEQNDTLRTIYGNMVGNRDWREDYITVKGRTKSLKEPSVTCAGLDVVKVGMHYDLIICDDLVSQANITSKDQMDKVIDFYKLAICLFDTGKAAEGETQMVVIGTRWHFNDLYNHLTDNERHVFNFFKRSSYNKDGSLWFPHRLSKEVLEDRKKSLGSAFFSCQYLNEPVDAEDARFKKEWINYYEPEEIKGKKLNTYITLDPAIAQEKGSDYSAIVTVGVDSGNIKYILNYRKVKAQPYELIDMLIDEGVRFKPEAIGIEEAVFAKMLSYLMNQKMAERGDYFRIIPIKPNWTRSKEMRIMSLQPIFEYRQIKVKREHTELVDELLRFPKGAHDDVVDALAYQVDMWTVPTPEEVEKNKKGSFQWWMDLAKEPVPKYQIGKYIAKDDYANIN